MIHPPHLAPATATPSATSAFQPHRPGPTPSLRGWGQKFLPGPAGSINSLGSALARAVLAGLGGLQGHEPPGMERLCPGKGWGLCWFEGTSTPRSLLRHPAEPPQTTCPSLAPPSTITTTGRAHHGQALPEQPPDQAGALAVTPLPTAIFPESLEHIPSPRPPSAAHCRASPGNQSKPFSPPCPRPTTGPGQAFCKQLRLLESGK